MLLVDRPALAHLFVRCDVRPETLAVTCIDGTPSPIVSWLRRGFRRGHRAGVLYLHDAATVIYPFTLEPVATLFEHSTAASLAYADIGMPPLGAPARRFSDPTLGDVPIRDVEELPPATLIRYCLRMADSVR